MIVTSSMITWLNRKFTRTPCVCPNKHLSSRLIWYQSVSHGNRILVDDNMLPLGTVNRGFRACLDILVATLRPAENWPHIQVASCNMKVLNPVCVGTIKGWPYWTGCVIVQVFIDDGTNDITCWLKTPQRSNCTRHKMYTGLWQETMKSDDLRYQQNHSY